MTVQTYCVITPARNEAKYIQQTIDSLVAQTIRPVEWIIVDDGSSDETSAIVERAMHQHPWILLVHAMDRGNRVVGAGVVEAFNLGLASVRTTNTAFLCKLDADLVLPVHYFERLMQYFDHDPRLGIACGQIRERIGNGFQMLRHEPEMVFGAAKFYRRACFDAIGGLEQSIGWDGIDCYQAMRYGWRTATLPDQELEILHLRRMGTSHKSILHGCTRRGRGLHYNRSHPVWAFASAIYRMGDRPYVIAGFCVFWGYFSAILQNTPRIRDPEFGRFLRAWQMKKLKRGMIRFVGGQSPARSAT